MLGSYFDLRQMLHKVLVHDQQHLSVRLFYSLPTQGYHKTGMAAIEQNQPLTFSNTMQQSEQRKNIGHRMWN